MAKEKNEAEYKLEEIEAKAAKARKERGTKFDSSTLEEALKNSKKKS